MVSLNSREYECITGRSDYTRAARMGEKIWIVTRALTQSRARSLYRQHHFPASGTMAIYDSVSTSYCTVD